MPNDYAVRRTLGLNRSQPLRDILAAMTPINPSIIAIMKIETGHERRVILSRAKQSTRRDRAKSSNR